MLLKSLAVKLLLYLLITKKIFLFEVFINSGEKKTNVKPFDFAKTMADCGVGEIILNSIDRDGTFKGYDPDTISISDSLTVPIIASTGCNDISDMLKV